MTVADPTLDYETGLHAEGARYVIGCDEVGRGALAGPVAVGICVVDASVGQHPAGLRDSKMLSEKRREELAPLAAGWGRHSTVGLATALEIDEFGIMYYAAGTVRGADLAPLFRYQPGNKLPAMFDEPRR